MLCLPSTKHGKQDFYPLKNWLDGDRLRVGGCFCARQATGQYHWHCFENDDALSRQAERRSEVQTRLTGRLPGPLASRVDFSSCREKKKRQRLDQK